MFCPISLRDAAGQTQSLKLLIFQVYPPIQQLHKQLN